MSENGNMCFENFQFESVNEKNNKQQLLELLKRNYLYSIDLKIFEYEHIKLMEFDIPILQNEISSFTEKMGSKFESALNKLYNQYIDISYCSFEAYILPTYELYVDEINYLLEMKINNFLDKHNYNKFTSQIQENTNTKISINNETINIISAKKKTYITKVLNKIKDFFHKIQNILPFHDIKKNNNPIINHNINIIKDENLNIITDNVENTTASNIKNTTIDNVENTTINNVENTTADNIENTSINNVENSTTDNVENTKADNIKNIATDDIKNITTNGIKNTTTDNPTLNYIEQSNMIDIIFNYKLRYSMDNNFLMNIIRYSVNPGINIITKKLIIYNIYICIYFEENNNTLFLRNIDLYTLHNYYLLNNKIIYFKFFIT